MNSVTQKLAGKKKPKRPLTPEEKKRQQRKGIIKAIVIVCIAIFGTWGFYEGMALFSGTSDPMVVVSSGSMVPHINVGDVLFVHHVNPADIKNGTVADETGDVIIYDSHGLWPNPENDPIVHRVVGKYFDNTTQQWYFYTKGDANPGTDQVLFDSLPVPADHVLGVVYGGIPAIGWVKIWLSNSGIVIPLLVLLGALLFITIVWDVYHPDDDAAKKGKGKRDELSGEQDTLTPVVTAWGYEEIPTPRPPEDAESSEDDPSPKPAEFSGENKEGIPPETLGGDNPDFV